MYNFKLKINALFAATEPTTSLSPAAITIAAATTAQPATAQLAVAQPSAA